MIYDSNLLGLIMVKFSWSSIVLVTTAWQILIPWQISQSIVQKGILEWVCWNSFIEMIFSSQMCRMDLENCSDSIFEEMLPITFLVFVIDLNWQIQ